MGRCARFGAPSRRVRLRLLWLKVSLTGYDREEGPDEVPDDRLVSTWSDKTLYMGSMEVGEITCRPDGSGWTYWSSDGGSFDVLRFAWLSSSRGHVDIQVRRSLFGWWTAGGSETRYQVESDRPDDAVWAVKYTISSGRDVLGNKVSLLEFDRDLSIGTLGRRFARKSTASADDPTLTASRRPRLRPGGGGSR